MATDEQGRERHRFGRWFHDTFHELGFRAVIGPAQTRNAVQGCDKPARDQWKLDLANRKRYTRDHRERRRLAREAQRPH
jgi:hypothetical protein